MNPNLEIGSMFPSAANRLLASLLCTALLCGCPTTPDLPADPAPDDDDSALPGDDDSAGPDDDDSAGPPPEDTGIEISVPANTPDAIGIRLEVDGTAVLDWTTVAPGEHYTIEPLPIGWYDLWWEGAGVAGTAQVAVCEAQVTEAEVPASPGAVFDCN